MSSAAVWQSSDAELLAELGSLETRLHSTWAQMLAVVAEIDSRGVAVTVGYGTTVELVRGIARVPRGVRPEPGSTPPPRCCPVAG